MAQKESKPEKTFLVFRILDWIRDMLTAVGTRLIGSLAFVVTLAAAIEIIWPGTIRGILRWLLGR